MNENAPEVAFQAAVEILQKFLRYFFISKTEKEEKEKICYKILFQLIS